MSFSKMTSNASFVEPTGVVIPGDEGPVSRSNRRSPFFKVSKTMIAGFGCAVAAVAFAGGYYVGPGASVATDDDAGGAGDPDAAMEASLDEMVQGNPLLRNLTEANINGIIEQYLAAPADYDDAFVPTEFAAIMAKTALQEGYVSPTEPAEPPADDRRRLGANDPALKVHRELSPVSALPKLAWQKIQSDYYPDPVRWSDDQATVYQEGGSRGRCWIIAQESNSIRDWINNLDLGKDPILSMKTYRRRDDSCGCEVKKWWQWWCQKYYECSVHIRLGDGSDASVKAYNNMRLGIKTRIEQKCALASSYVFAGYSRGGGIAAVIAYAVWKDGILPANKMTLITFGAPRALKSGESDDVHGKFIAARYVHKNDPVPTFPSKLWSYKHYGAHFCKDCKQLGRNRPYYRNLLALGDHTSYDDWIL